MPARTRPDLQMSKPDRRRATPPGNKSSRPRQLAQCYPPIAEYYWRRIAAVRYVLVDPQAYRKYFFISPAFHLSRRNTNNGLATGSLRYIKRNILASQRNPFAWLF